MLICSYVHVGGPFLGAALVPAVRFYDFHDTNKQWAVYGLLYCEVIRAKLRYYI